MPSHPQAFAIGVLEYPNAQLAAVHGLEDLFGTASRLHAELGGKGPPILPIRLPVESSWPSPEVRLTAIIVPPSLGAPPDPASIRPLAAWMAERHREGAVLCSVCAGAFILAETGLLAARRATTHWALRACFAERFPDVRLDTQKIIIDDGDLITAGGVMAWVDLGLHLIGRFLGPAVMLSTARHWVVDPGGREQRFYDCFAPALTHGDDAVLSVQHFLQARFAEKISLAGMARVAKLGQRTFLRRFQRATGHTPTDYLALLRVERARDQLELSTDSFDEIAWRLGYNDAGAFRRVFQRVMGLSPGEYRRRFGVRR